MYPCSVHSHFPAIDLRFRVLARELNRPVYALDLRNHGDSPHNPQHTYRLLAADVSHFLAKHAIKNPTLIGHSMGAKAAMCVALESPSSVKNLIPVDNAPVDANFASDFGKYLQGMREVVKVRPKRQSEADDALKPYAKVFLAVLGTVYNACP
jgi:pimeloyl-ACP methyl ester carboxylesterase